MESITKQTLQNLIEQAQKLKELKVDDYLQRAIQSLRKVAGENKVWNPSFSIPGFQEMSTLLEQIRVFVQGNEQISLRRIDELLKDGSISSELKEGIETASQIFKELLNNYSIETIKLFNGLPTRGQILETVLSVSLGNTDNQNLLEQFKQWTRDNLRASLLQEEFDRTLLEVYVLIDYLADLSEKELARGIA